MESSLDVFEAATGISGRALSVTVVESLLRLLPLRLLLFNPSTSSTTANVNFPPGRGTAPPSASSSADDSGSVSTSISISISSSVSSTHVVGITGTVETVKDGLFTVVTTGTASKAGCNTIVGVSPLAPAIVVPITVLVGASPVAPSTETTLLATLTLLAALELRLRLLRAPLVNFSFQSSPCCRASSRVWLQSGQHGRRGTSSGSTAKMEGSMGGDVACNAEELELEEDA